MAQTLAQSLASQIADGRWPPGSALPSTRTMASELGCAPGTVARAYGELRRAGLIAGRDGARARVEAGSPPRARWWLSGGPPPPGTEVAIELDRDLAVVLDG
jgi:GntR family transcriptional regulator/MocR family aminotransferase